MNLLGWPFEDGNPSRPSSCQVFNRDGYSTALGLKGAACKENHWNSLIGEKSRITDWQWCCKFGAASSVLYLPYFLLLIILWSINLFYNKKISDMHTFIKYMYAYINICLSAICMTVGVEKNRVDMQSYEEKETPMHTRRVISITWYALIFIEQRSITWSLSIMSRWKFLGLGAEPIDSPQKKGILHFLGRGNF